MSTKPKTGAASVATAYEVGYGKPPVEYRFKPGQSGNPFGRPKKAKEIAKKAEENAELALQTLVGICKDPKATNAAKVSAATQILDRGLGRAPQNIDVDHKHSLADELENVIRGLNGQPVIDITPSDDD